MRIPEDSMETLRQLAQETGWSMREVLERALDSYQEQLLLDRANQGYAALQRDPALARQVEQEYAARARFRQERQARLLEGQPLGVAERAGPETAQNEQA